MICQAPFEFAIQKQKRPCRSPSELQGLRGHHW